MTRYHEIVEANPGVGVDEIMAKLEEEGFTDGVLRYVPTQTATIQGLVGLFITMRK